MVSLWSDEKKQNIFLPTVTSFQHPKSHIIHPLHPGILKNKLHK